jgi:2-dehydro-3-deoxyphosphogluconate aldolase / (4S)-4-hydroxy-2-oxoglutarate aldolase
VTERALTGAVDQLRRVGLVPVVRAPSAEEALQACRALVLGGLTGLEVTMTVPGAHEVIRELRKDFGERVLVGAGTVTSVSEVDACLRAGAQFIVTPVCLPELVAPTHEAAALVALGALTPTEVWTAWSAGADVVKVFPASALGGPTYIQALRAPFPQVKLMPTGGVSLSTIEPFLAAGAFALGVGGALVDATQLRERGVEYMAEQARVYVAKFNEARSRA